MDSFGGFSTINQGDHQWDLCSSILTLEELDFTPADHNAWFCSLDSSFTAANLPAAACVFGANYPMGDENNGIVMDQFPCVFGADDHNYNMCMSSGEIEDHCDQKKMESFFSACTDILLQEAVTGINGEEDHRFVNMDVVETNNLGDNKRKSVVVVAAADDHKTKLDNPNKKIRTSNNVSKLSSSFKFNDVLSVN